MNAKMLNYLRLAAQYWIPALGTLVFTLGSIWDWTFTENLVGSIMAFDTFLGVLLGFQTRGTAQPGYDGQLVINTTNPIKDVYTVDLGETLAKLPDKDSVTLRIVNETKSQE
jgi:Putative phage holin Dp-1